jgi:hypothetical protein
VLLSLVNYLLTCEETELSTATGLATTYAVMVILFVLYLDLIAVCKYRRW